MELLILNISYKNKCMMYDFLCLVPFT
jgi:hypothetical protein